MWKGVLSILILAALPLVGQIEEEDLPLSVETDWSMQLDEARSVFASADQPQAIPLLSVLIEELEEARIRGALDETGRLLLVEALALRGEAAFNLGDRQRAESDVDRLVVLDPSFVADRDLVSPKFWTLFERMRGRHVGEIDLVLDPPDARVALDGRELPIYAASVSVLAGDYGLSVERPGYEAVQRQLTVRAGRQNNLEVTLVRTGAVISLISRPKDVRVKIDGIERGQTGGSAPPDLLPVGEAARYPRSEFSDRLLIGELFPGSHEIELVREGYRSERHRIVIEENIDYDLGVHVLERSRGVIRLVGLPAGAAVRVDGAAALPDRRFSGAPSLNVAPGAHAVEVEHGAQGIFQAGVRVEDGQTVDLEVHLRPALALIGIEGGSETQGTQLADRLEEALETSDWMLYDARDRIGEIEGFNPQALSRIYPLSFPDAIVGDWRLLQQAAAHNVPASVLAFGIVDGGGDTQLWLLPAAPAPALAQVWPATNEGLEDLSRQLSATIQPEPWLGMLLTDVNGPLVMSVDPGSPADQAGLEIGDRIMAVGGRAVETAAGARGLIAPAESIQVEVTGPAGRRTVAIKQLRSWRVPTPNSPGLLRAMLYREPPPEAPEWLAPWLRAVARLDAGRWEDAEPELALVRAREGESPGADALDYQKAISLLAAATGGRDRAVALLEGLTEADGRLGQPDGVPVKPLASLRLAALQGD